MTLRGQAILGRDHSDGCPRARPRTADTRGRDRDVRRLAGAPGRRQFRLRERPAPCWPVHRSSGTLGAVALVEWLAMDQADAESGAKRSLRGRMATNVG